MIQIRHILIPLLVLLFVTNGQTQNDSTAKVFILDIKANIDPRMNRQVSLAFEEATTWEADYIVIEMDTYGGAVTDANDIVTTILDYEKPVYVFINKDAASAGALISIACDSIYMARGASIGAATVVTAEGIAAPDKYQSYMRSTMRSTAEAKGRDPKIAEAMVDQTIELDSISPAGQVLTFSTTEAIKHGYCEAQVTSIEEIMERSGIENYETYKYELTVTEKIIAFFLNPFVSGILIMMIIGGIYFELQTPGVGFPILAAAIALVFYFVPYYLNGLAANWEIVAFFVGIVLIGLEVFVIPGFGVAGIAGISLTIGSLMLVMINNDMFDFSFVDGSEIFVAALTTVTALILSIAVMVVGGVRLSQSKVFQKIALVDEQKKEEGYTSRFNQVPLMDKEGVAYTKLRPSGKVLIDGELYDAFTRGNFIEKDDKIIVISEEGTSLKVKKV